MSLPWKKKDTTSAFQGISLAEKLKKIIQEEELASTSRFHRQGSASTSYINESPDPILVNLPRRFPCSRLKKEQKQKEALKMAEIEEDEENYRWQISKSLIRTEHSELESEPYELDSQHLCPNEDE